MVKNENKIRKIITFTMTFKKKNCQQLEIEYLFKKIHEIKFEYLYFRNSDTDKFNGISYGTAFEMTLVFWPYNTTTNNLRLQ